MSILTRVPKNGYMIWLYITAEQKLECIIIVYLFKNHTVVALYSQINDTSP
jgi:hypothetical protein